MLIPNQLGKNAGNIYKLHVNPSFSRDHYGAMGTECTEEMGAQPGGQAGG